MAIDWFNCRTEPVIETDHECIVEKTVSSVWVTCDNLWCAYRESFETVEEAEVAAEIHMRC